MRLAMRKPQDTPFNLSVTCLTELNNYPPILLGYSTTKKMPPEDINEILLHSVPNGWEKQAYIQGCNFDITIYKAKCELFKRMEVAEKNYKGGNNSKTTITEDTNHTSHGRKRKGGEAASPTNTEKIRAGKHKTRNVGHPSDRPIRGKTCLLHGPGNSTEECKVLKN